MEQTVRMTSSEREIWRAAKHQGIRRMAQDGAVKILRGITTLDEVSRTVSVEDEIELSKEIASNPSSDALSDPIPEISFQEDTTEPQTTESTLPPETQPGAENSIKPE